MFNCNDMRWEMNLELNRLPACDICGLARDNTSLAKRIALSFLNFCETP